MPFTVDKLLLTETRKSQLTVALANLGVADPLGSLISEAVSEVNRFTAGYVIDENSLNGWIRTITLYKAYTVAELGVPEDLTKAFEVAMKELSDIAAGKRPNLPTTPVDEETPSPTGGWGSETKITIRDRE